MKVVKRTSSPKFEPITLEITIESQDELTIWLGNLERIAKGKVDTGTAFDVYCSQLLSALNKN